MERDSILHTAFDDLRNYVHREIYKAEKTFYDGEHDDSYQRVFEVDRTNHVMKVYPSEIYDNQPDDYYETWSLEKEIQYMLMSKIENCVSHYEAITLDIHENKILRQYKIFYSGQVDKIFNYKVLSDFNFLPKYKNYIKDKIIKHTNMLVDVNGKLTDTTTTFDIKQQISIQSLFTNFPIHKIEKLYLLLTQGKPFIAAEETDFINAFSGRGVSMGIKWLVKGSRNKKDISKPTLFYLIEQLMEIGLIKKNQDDLKTIVLTLFRDEDGNCFKSGSLDTSISTYKKGQNKPKPTITTRKKDIDNIISELLIP